MHLREVISKIRNCTGTLSGDGTGILEEVAGLSGRRIQKRTNETGSLRMLSDFSQSRPLLQAR